MKKHGEIDVPNLHVMNVMKSLKSREYVRETFSWQYYYYYLTDEGIEYLRSFLNLPSTIKVRIARLHPRASERSGQRARRAAQKRKPCCACLCARLAGGGAGGGDGGGDGGDGGDGAVDPDGGVRATHANGSRPRNCASDAFSSPLSRPLSGARLSPRRSTRPRARPAVLRSARRAPAAAAAAARISTARRRWGPAPTSGRATGTTPRAAALAAARQGAPSRARRAARAARSPRFDDRLNVHLFSRRSSPRPRRAFRGPVYARPA
jgi:small subunit ribosomal protein S10e